jgi:hypothetical protein
MKTFITISLTLVIALFLSACDSGSRKGQKPTSVTTTQNIHSSSLEDISNKATPPLNNPSESKTENITVEEHEIFNQDDIAITLKSLNLEDSFFGPELKLLIENDNTKDITVQIRNVSINDIMVNSIFSCDVVSGKKANDAISFMSSSLDIARIKTIKKIEFYFHIFDSDTWDTIVDSKAICVETSADSSFVQEYDDSGYPAINTKDFKIVIKKLDNKESFWGADLYVYIENNFDQDVTIQVRDVSINGFMVSPSFSCDVLAGKRAFDSITFLESELTDNDITDITSIELTFHIFDMNEWNTIYDSDIVSISFENNSTASVAK